MPDTAEPSPSNPEPEAHKVTAPTDISNDEYHELADRYMDHLCEKAEQLQETREEVDVEFSVSTWSIELLGLTELEPTTDSALNRPA